MQSYKDLIVYQKGYKLSLEVYQATKNFPKEEIYGLVSQMRRSAVSIPCNISEGYRRGHRKEYIQFLHMAHGSCAELETHLVIAKELGYLNENLSVEDLLDHISRMIVNLDKKI